jgi:hypothetical protein
MNRNLSIQYLSKGIKFDCLGLHTVGSDSVEVTANSSV